MADFVDLFHWTEPALELAFAKLCREFEPAFELRGRICFVGLRPPLLVDELNLMVVGEVDVLGLMEVDVSALM